jgi:hypothetical protein
MGEFIEEVHRVKECGVSLCNDQRHNLCYLAACIFYCYDDEMKIDMGRTFGTHWGGEYPCNVLIVKPRRMMNNLGDLILCVLRDLWLCVFVHKEVLNKTVCV